MTDLFFDSKRILKINEEKLIYKTCMTIKIANLNKLNYPSSYIIKSQLKINDMTAPNQEGIIALACQKGLNIAKLDFWQEVIVVSVHL